MMITIPLTFETDFFNEDGTFRDVITLSASLSAFDRETGQQFPVYPPPDMDVGSVQELDIRTVTVDDGEGGQKQLLLSIWYVRTTATEAALTAATADQFGNILTSETISVYQRMEMVTVSLNVDAARLPAGEPLQISVSLENGETTLTDSLMLTTNVLEAADEAQLWFISADVVNKPLGSEPDTQQLRVAVGYSLPADYESGMVEHEFSTVQVSQTGSGGGGGGQPVEPGSGVLILFVPLNQEQQVMVDGWPVGLQLQLILQASLADGSMIELANLEQP